MGITWGKIASHVNYMRYKIQYNNYKHNLLVENFMIEKEIKKVGKRGDIRISFKKSENVNLGKVFILTPNEVDEIIDENENLKNQLQECKKNMASTSNNEKLEINIEEIAKKNNKLKEDIKDNEIKHLQTLNDEKEHFVAKIEQSNKELQNKSKEIAKIQEDIKTLENKYKMEISNLQTQINDLKDENHTLDTNNKTLVANISILINKLKSMGTWKRLFNFKPTINNEIHSMNMDNLESTLQIQEHPKE